MKKVLSILFLIVSAVLQVSAQHSCCNSQALAFSDLSSDPAFVKAHAEPLPFVYEPKFGRMVALQTADGKEAKAFEAKAGAGDGRIIIMFHEWWGLNDYIKKEAEKYAVETGHTVLALDLFDGKVTADREEAAKLTQTASESRIRTIILAGLDYAGKHGQVQTIGWCFGGGWSLQAAIEGGAKVKGCVIFYGMPETDTSRIAKLQAPVLGLFAKKDNHITSQIVEKFNADMKALNKPVEIKMYDAVHAFANPSNPQYDKAAAADATQKAIEFLKKNYPEYKK